MDAFSIVFILLIVTVLLYLGIVWCFGIGARSVQSFEARCARLCKGTPGFTFEEIEPFVFLGSKPCLPNHIMELKAHGIGAVLTLNESWELMLSGSVIEEDCGLAHRHLPTPDFFAPLDRDIMEAVIFIQRHAQRGVGVYVHCNAGRGRSAVCVICYLIWQHGIDAMEALAIVREHREIADLTSCCGRKCQWRAVLRFAERVKMVKHKSKEGAFSPSMYVKPKNMKPTAPLPGGAWGGDAELGVAKLGAIAHGVPHGGPKLGGALNGHAGAVEKIAPRVSKLAAQGSPVEIARAAATAARLAKASENHAAAAEASLDASQALAVAAQQVAKDASRIASSGSQIAADDVEFIATAVAGVAAAAVASVEAAEAASSCMPPPPPPLAAAPASPPPRPPSLGSSGGRRKPLNLPRPSPAEESFPYGEEPGDKLPGAVDRGG